MIEVEILTRTDCHLCEEMKDALSLAATGLDVELTETDIDADEKLTAQYGHDIPVLFVNGEKAFEHRATVEELKRRLRMAAG